MIGPGKKEFDVNIQSQTSQLFRYFLMIEQKADITLADAITSSITRWQGKKKTPGKSSKILSWSQASQRIHEITISVLT